MPNTSTAGRFGRLGWLWLTVLVLVIDLASKVYFDNALEMYQQIVVIPDLFSWTLAYNTGAAFSFLAESAGWQLWHKYQTNQSQGASVLYQQLLETTLTPDGKPDVARVADLANKLKSEYAGTAYSQFGGLFVAKVAVVSSSCW